MVVVVVCAGAAILVGEQVWHADARWYTIPAALVAVAVTSGLVWTVILRTRVAAANRTLESLGLALAFVGTVDAWAMLAQGISGFTLPAAPLLLLQAVAMGLLLLLPLWVPRTAPDGLERLPLHAQVRHGWVAVAVTLAALPPIFVLALVRREEQAWALPFLCVVVMVLLALAMIRQLLAFNESRHLYHLVAEGADERRRLLAEIMRSVDEDRHRFASQLHEQAISSYVAFASMTQSVRSRRSRTGHDRPGRRVVTAARRPRRAGRVPAPADARRPAARGAGPSGQPAAVTDRGLLRQPARRRVDGPACGSRSTSDSTSTGRPRRSRCASSRRRSATRGAMLPPTRSPSRSRSSTTCWRSASATTASGSSPMPCSSSPGWRRCAPSARSAAPT